MPIPRNIFSRLPSSRGHLGAQCLVGPDRSIHSDRCISGRATRGGDAKEFCRFIPSLASSFLMPVEQRLDEGTNRRSASAASSPPSGIVAELGWADDVAMFVRTKSRACPGLSFGAKSP